MIIKENWRNLTKRVLLYTLIVLIGDQRYPNHRPDRNKIEISGDPGWSLGHDNFVGRGSEVSTRGQDLQHPFLLSWAWLQPVRSAVKLVMPKNLGQGIVKRGVAVAPEPPLSQLTQLGDWPALAYDLAIIPEIISQCVLTHYLLY